MCPDHDRDCCCEQGPQGIQGIQGIQGLQGCPGKDCEHHKCECKTAYCNVYSLTQQIKGAFGSGSDVVMFDSQAEVSAEFDISQKNITGEIKFLKHGIYVIDWIGQANVTPPIPAPVPAFSFGFWLDGILLPGSVNSSFTQSPNDDNSHVNGKVIVEVKTGQVLTLRNASVLAITMNPLPSGSAFPIANASISIVLVKELY